MHRNRPAGAECRSVMADELDVADAIELLVVGHSGLTIAEADLWPQIEIDVNSAIGGLALIRPPLSPLIDREGPRGFGPDRPVAMRIRRRRCGAEEGVPADRSDEYDGGDGYDARDHDHSSMAQTASAAKSILRPMIISKITASGPPALPPAGLLFRRIHRDCRNEAVSVRHFDLRQGLGVHDLVFLDDAVPIEQEGSHGVDFVMSQRSRLRDWHCAVDIIPRERRKRIVGYAVPVLS